MEGAPSLRQVEEEWDEELWEGRMRVGNDWNVNKIALKSCCFITPFTWCFIKKFTTHFLPEKTAMQHREPSQLRSFYFDIKMYHFKGIKFWPLFLRLKAI